MKNLSKNITAARMQNQFGGIRAANNMSQFVSLISYVSILLAFLAPASNAQAQPRLAGSVKPADIHNYPYQVSVHAYNAYKCSSVIISDEWILTTVHCLRFPRSDLTIRAGSAELDSAGSLHKVSKIVNHDHYGSNLARFNDIALAKVEPKFEFDETKQPIGLVDAKVSVTEGDKGVISGWGTLGKGEEKPVLKAVEVNVMSLLDCVETYHSRFGNLLPGIVCAKNERANGGAACSEIISADDSGAPLVVGGKLAGVFSWGYRCQEPGFPSVFMEVAYYRDWIKQNSGV